MFVKLLLCWGSLVLEVAVTDQTFRHTGKDGSITAILETAALLESNLMAVHELAPGHYRISFSCQAPSGEREAPHDCSTVPCCRASPSSSSFRKHEGLAQHNSQSGGESGVHIFEPMVQIWQEPGLCTNSGKIISKTSFSFSDSKRSVQGALATSLLAVQSCSLFVLLF